jgi:dissimilatory sulfite reductase alpha subunit
MRIHRTLLNNFTDDVHRPALPYKFKFKVSGCGNDCMNSIERADFAIIGTWRDDMKVDQEAFKEYVAAKGRQHTIDNIITRCPTNALSLNDDDTLEVDNRNCVRCMHCLNVVPKALSPGDDKGVTILMGGKRTLKIGDLMGTVIVPFMKLEDDEDYEGQFPRRYRRRGRSEHDRRNPNQFLCAHGRLGYRSQEVVRPQGRTKSFLNQRQLRRQNMLFEIIAGAR